MTAKALTLDLAILAGFAVACALALSEHARADQARGELAQVLTRTERVATDAEACTTALARYQDAQRAEAIDAAARRRQDAERAAAMDDDAAADATPAPIAAIEVDTSAQAREQWRALFTGDMEGPR